MTRKHLLIIPFLIWLNACTSMQLRYEATIDVPVSKSEAKDSPKTIEKEVVYEKSYDTTLSAVFCGLTAIFYGGYCWAYMAMPFDGEELEMEREAEKRIRKKFPTFSTFDSDIKVKRWSDRPERFYIRNSYSASDHRMENDHLRGKKRKKPVKEQASISTARYIGGGVASIYLGLGVGQYIQGRHDDGLTYLAGDLGSMLLIYAGALNCGYGGCSGNGLTMMILGGVFYITSRVAQAIDSWIAPGYKIGSSNVEPYLTFEKDEALVGLNIPIK